MDQVTNLNPNKIYIELEPSFEGLILIKKNKDGRDVMISIPKSEFSHEFSESYEAEFKDDTVK